MNQLALFPKAKPGRARPVEPIARSAEVEGPYRYKLERAWGGGPAVGWILLNPSTADGQRDDPTCWEMMCHSLRLGFGSMVVVNVYPYITPDPKKLAVWRARQEVIGWINAGAYQAFCHNARRAARALDRVQTRIVAWGNNADLRDVEDFMDRIATADPDDCEGEPIVWHCLGKTASGAPIHPLARGKHRIPNDQRLIAWK